MTWNYRVILDQTPHGDWYLSIREVYYDDDGNIEMWSAMPDPIVTEDLNTWSLFQQWRMFADAFGKPMVDVTGEQAGEAGGFAPFGVRTEVIHDGSPPHPDTMAGRQT
jgi:hypothetical protein